MLEKVISVERENVTFECSNNIGFLLGIDFRCRCRFVVTDVVVAIVIIDVVVDVVDEKNTSLDLSGKFLCQEMIRAPGSVLTTEPYAPDYVMVVNVQLALQHLYCRPH